MLSRSSIQLNYSLMFIVTLALVFGALFIGIHQLKTRQLRNEAMAVAEQVVAFRAWIANTGVVWVDHLAPEFKDFLGKRTSGTTEAFYSKNPALATRELSEIVSQTATRATFRVTSDEYRNPANAPIASRSHPSRRSKKTGTSNTPTTSKAAITATRSPFSCSNPA